MLGGVAHLEGAEEGEDVWHRGLAALGMHSTPAQHSVLLQCAQLCAIHDLDRDLLSRQGILRLHADGAVAGWRRQRGL